MRGLTATATAPAQIVPRKATTQSMPSSSLIATLSPGPMPRACQAEAARATACRNAPRLIEALPQTRAVAASSWPASRVSAALRLAPAASAVAAASGISGAPSRSWLNRPGRPSAQRLNSVASRSACSRSSAASSRNSCAAGEPGAKRSARSAKKAAARCSRATAMRNRLAGSCGRLWTSAKMAANSSRNAGDGSGTSRW